MGRTNGKILPFLKGALDIQKYMNLKYEENSDVFYLDLPRYHRGIDPHYEVILKDWYGINPHLKWKTYSESKAVFKAAIKKSVYVLSLRNHEKRLRFRFATKDETDEKRREQKERSHIPDNPPSVASSGYHSAESDDPDALFAQDAPNPQRVVAEILPCDSNSESEFQTEGDLVTQDLNLSSDIDWDSILMNEGLPTMSLSEVNALIDSFGESLKKEVTVNPDENKPSTENTAIKNEACVAVCPENDVQQFAPEIENSLRAPVHPLELPVSKRWLCNSRINFGSVVQYVFHPDMNLSDGNMLSPEQTLLNLNISSVNPGISLELFIRTEWMFDGMMLQKLDFISGKTTNEIYLVLYFT